MSRYSGPNRRARPLRGDSAVPPVVLEAEAYDRQRTKLKQFGEPEHLRRIKGGARHPATPFLGMQSKF
jgi:hypothetical protein